MVSDHEIPAEGLSVGDSYRLMTSLITPRPIAWVSTISEDGVRNLAPYSYFQGVCSDPPTIILGASWTGEGRPKDTLANVLANGELTISIVSRELAEVMSQTSAAYSSETEEWVEAGVASAAATSVAPPRVAGALAALECRLTHAIPLGQGKRGGPSSTLVIARIEHFHVREGLIRRDANDKLMPPDPGALDTVGRLGGIAYTTTRDRFEVPRPKLP